MFDTAYFDNHCLEFIMRSLGRPIFRIIEQDTGADEAHGRNDDNSEAAEHHSEAVIPPKRS
jgi:hypothetical protein